MHINNHILWIIFKNLLKTHIKKKKGAKDLTVFCQQGIPFILQRNTQKERIKKKLVSWKK